MSMTIQNPDICLQRADLSVIKDMIPRGSKILDLGCGSGRLLFALKTLKEAKVTGVEVDQQMVLECVVRGVSVIQLDLNGDLKEFSDNSYDYVILSRTLQAVHHPDQILNSMLRIGKRGIVSFMNFGHVNSRMQVMLGKMPVNRNLPRPWYDTPTIHPGTIADFRDLCRTLNIRIVKEIPLTNLGDFMPFLARLCPNLFASNCIFIIEK